ncbi:MAG: type II toxin-antitoxin system RelE/ParE family toxin [Terricaulis silvestris]
MKGYSVEVTSGAQRDLRSIFAFLVRSYRDFGESFPAAKRSASRRVERIEDSMEVLAKAPHQGTQRNNVASGLRAVTIDRAIFYFAVDDDARLVRIVAIFFGGQDHERAMLRRLLTNR